MFCFCKYFLKWENCPKISFWKLIVTETAGYFYRLVVVQSSDFRFPSWLVMVELLSFEVQILGKKTGAELFWHNTESVAMLDAVMISISGKVTSDVEWLMFSGFSAS